MSRLFKIFLLVVLSFLSGFNVSANDTFFSIEKQSSSVKELAQAGGDVLLASVRSKFPNISTSWFDDVSEALLKKMDDLPTTSIAKFEADIASTSGNALKNLFKSKPNSVKAWKHLLNDAIRTNTTYLSAVSKQIDNYGTQVAFKFDKTLPHIPTDKLDNFFAAVDNPKSIDHLRSLTGDFDNIPGINLSAYVPNSLPKVDIPAPATWADPLLHLPANAAPTFTNATAKTLSPGQKIYRVLGDGQLPDGGYWTYQLPSSKADLFGGTAVRPEWNAATHYVEYTIPPNGLKVWDGPTARQPILDDVGTAHLPGGDTQIYIPDAYRQVGNDFENLPLNTINW